MNRQVVLGLLGFCALAIVGCGGAPSDIAKTTGKVTYQGASVVGATVTMATEDNSKIEDEVRKEVVSLCSNFPIYKHLG